MATAIPGSAQTLDELRWRFTDLAGKALPEDDRMRQFALRYAKRFMKQCGSPPEGDHPFPNPWEPTFLIEYYGPGGSEAERHRRFLEQTSASQA